VIENLSKYYIEGENFMKIDNDFSVNKIGWLIEDNSQFKISNEDNDELKKVVNDFTSILMKQMFKSMRDTINESNFINGGLAEDIFTDMLDSEISSQGAAQQGFNSLGRLLYEELNNK
jgi:Rod binding domain-containing protein